MKITKNVLAILFLFLSSSKVFADSPLTSTEFYKAYSTEIIIKEAAKSNGILTSKLKIYLADPLQSIDVKMALINRLGWKAKGKKNSKIFMRYLKKIRGFKTDESLINSMSGEDLTCLAYIKAMDNYFDVEKALEYSNLAIKKSPNSFTTNIINALIKSQKFQNNNSCKVYQVLEDVRVNSSLKYDFKKEATDVIFEYVTIYKKYCK
jgi:hypothetical protein